MDRLATWTALISSIVFVGATGCSSNDGPADGAATQGGGGSGVGVGGAAGKSGAGGKSGSSGVGGSPAKAGSSGIGGTGTGGSSGTGSSSGGSGGNGASGGAGGGGKGGSIGTAGSAGAAGGAAAAGASGTGGGASACSSPFTDPLAGQRAMCAFGAGDKAATTLGIAGDVQKKIPIKHIIVMMKENRAFDHLLGHLAQAGQPGADGIPSTFTNKDKNGVDVPFTHATSTCISHDPGHQWNEMHAQVDAGAMDGFVTSAAKTTGTDGHFAMSYYDENDLPFFYFIANTYALNDRHFASARSGTFPDRNFLLFGTANGVKCTGCGYPATSLDSIFKQLDKASVSWAAYTDGDYFSGTLGSKPQSYFDASHLRGGITTGNKAFFTDIAAADFPSVVFVDGDDNVTDDHPTANLQVGEDWSRQIYEAAVKSPHWNDMALLWTYDEAGGFADHVPPPPNDVAQTPVCLDGDPKDANFTELGVRVPMAVISPYARPHHVSHVVQEHTAITRFIATVFDLPALTKRDANSDALLDMFDFDCPPALVKPPQSPAPGVGGCGANSVHLTTDKPLYAPGEPIQVTFTGGPGNDNLDWIAAYNYGDVPHSGSLVWVRSDGERTNTPMACPAGCPANGTVTLKMGDENGTNWPLPVGQYIIYYLVHDGYTSLGSVDFIVQ